MRARTDIVSFPRPNNISDDSYSDNDKQGDNDSDDSFLGGINLKWSLFFLGNKIGSSLLLNMSLNAVSLFLAQQKQQLVLW